jgi:uncharacterized protein YciI
MPHFVVITEQGPRWDEKQEANQQEDGDEHHSFMSALETERIVLLGGPLGDSSKNRALLIMDAANEQEARSKLADDPWMRSDVLKIIELYPWVIRYGGGNFSW